MSTEDEKNKPLSPKDISKVKNYSQIGESQAQQDQIQKGGEIPPRAPRPNPSPSTPTDGNDSKE